MTTYNSYEEAKIANPDKDIYQFSPLIGVKFTCESMSVTGEPLQPCNPADHCMTVEKFLADGHEFFVGDLIIGTGNAAITVGDGYHLEDCNEKCIYDVKRYILRAAALNKPKRTKVEYERVDFVDHWEYFKLMGEEGDLYVSCVDLTYEGLYGDNINLANALQDGSCIYRRIETEIDERQEFIEECMLHGGLRARDGAKEVYGNLFDSGKFKLVEGD